MKIYKIDSDNKILKHEIFDSERIIIKEALAISKMAFLVNHKLLYIIHNNILYLYTDIPLQSKEWLIDKVSVKIDTETPDITAFEFFKGNVKTVRLLPNSNYQVRFEKSKAVLNLNKDYILPYFTEYCQSVLGLSSSIDLVTFNTIHYNELKIATFEIKENYQLELVLEGKSFQHTIELNFINEAKLYSWLEYNLPSGCYTTVFQYGITKASLCDLNVVSYQVKSFKRQGNSIKLNYCYGNDNDNYSFSLIGFKDLIQLESYIEARINKVRIFGQFNLEFNLEFDKLAKNELNYLPSLDSWVVKGNEIEYKLKSNVNNRVEYVDLDLLDKQIKSLNSVYKKPTINISCFTPENMIKAKFMDTDDAFTKLADEIVSTIEGNAEFLKAKEWVKLTFHRGKEYSNFESLAMAFKEGTIDYKEFENKVAELITVKKKSYTTITLPSDISMLTQLLQYYEICLGEPICSDGKNTTYVFDSPNAERDGTYELTINGLVKLTIPSYTSAQST